MGVLRNKTTKIKVRMVQLGGTATTGHYPKLKIFFGGKSEVKQISTDCISVSGRLSGDMRKHMFEKIIGCGQGK
jgi:hypothetical protein